MPGTYEGENGEPVTAEEHRAIQSLHRLAKRWPRSLTLVSMGGSLHVIHTGDPRYGELAAEPRGDSVLDTFQGIPNDGGDW
jgi:hypothetical protein